MTSLNNHILFSLAVRNRLPKPDGSSYKLQFDKNFDARSIFQKKFQKEKKNRQITACIFSIAGPESSAKTGQIKLSAAISQIF